MPWDIIAISAATTLTIMFLTGALFGRHRRRHGRCIRATAGGPGAGTPGGGDPGTPASHP